MTIIEPPRTLERAYELVPRGFSLEGWKEISLVDGETAIEAKIPLHKIEEDVVPILDTVNLCSLGSKIDDHRAQNRGFEGQILPALLGIVVDDTNSLVVIDGFHRRHLAERRHDEGRGSGFLFSKVLPQIDFADMMRLRVDFTHDDHTKLELARIVNWAREYWLRRSQWADEISVVDAFKVTENQQPRAQIGPEDCVDITNWVREHFDWKVRPKDILKFLSSTESMSDEVVELIRSGRNFNLNKANMLAQAFPGEDECQLRIAEVIDQERLSLPRIEALVSVVQSLQDISEFDDAIANFLRYSTSGVSGSSRGSGKPSTSSVTVLPRQRTLKELILELRDRFPAEIESSKIDPDLVIELGHTLIDLATGSDGSEVEEMDELSFADMCEGYLKGNEECRPELINDREELRTVRALLRRLKYRLDDPSMKSRFEHLNALIVGFNHRA